MLLGKRQRPPMKRTTSMTEFTLDLNHTTILPHDHDHHHHHPNTTTTSVVGQHHLSSPTLLPKIHRRNSADYSQTSNFLKACHLCKRNLIAGRDIFMYRGDSAFCSLECRQQQMNQDEKKDKCSMLSNKHHNTSSAPPPIAAPASNASETVVAAM